MTKKKIEEPTLYRQMQESLHEAVGSLTYYKPEKFDDAEHERAWNEMITEKKELLALVQAAPEPEYTFDDLEAVACMWEHVLQRLRRVKPGDQNPWDDFRTAYGMATLRGAVIRHVPVIEAAYQKAKANGFDAPFDWEFVPKYMEDHVTRILVPTR